MTGQPAVGRYRHYKGNEYTVVGIARHSETLQEFVVYRPEYGERGLWVRPREMFLETVNIAGQCVPRFARLEESAKSDLPAVEAGNLFANIPATLPEELIEVLLKCGNVRIERIVSQGQASPADYWYDQDQPEWVMVVQGEARLEFETGELLMKAGDFVNIPAGKKHRVAGTKPGEQTVWLAVFYQ